MLTRNFYSLIGSVLQSSDVAKGLLPVTDTYGMQYFSTGQFTQFPYTRTASYTSDRYAAGITVGSGGSPVKETDFQLESPISSGLNVALTSKTVGTDDQGAYIQYNLTITNTSSSAVTLREIGYKQPVLGCPYLGSTSSSAVSVMVDRTLIEPTITLAPQEASVVRYKLRTLHEDMGTVGGVSIVSWQFGSDADVAAMIEAARQGTIDLSDYWQVGDMRECLLDGFTGGNGVRNEAQTIDLVITAFGDYNESGSVMQVDFAECLSTAVRINSTNSNSGGYGTSEMCTTTLPALYDAMPSWLRSLMLPFDVLSSAGAGSSTIETVSDNKLALRSEIEVRGATGGGSTAGEGDPVAWYQTASKMRQKRRGRAGSTNTYWLRSPASGSTQYVTVSRADASTYGGVNATNTNGFAPFFCL